MPIRPDAIPLQSPNEGLVVFLYDDAHRQAIAAAAPSVLGGFRGPRELEDETLRRLAREGTLVAFELMQDDALDLEIVVGEPLSDAERDAAGLRRGQRAYIQLPSGRLCVEGYDTLRAGPEDPLEEAAAVDVAPGPYRVAVHHFDPDHVRWADGRSASPSIVLCLTPDEGARSDDAPAMLLYGAHA